MIHFQLPFQATEGKTYTISGDDFHYLAHVLRVAVGQTIECVDAHGGRLRGDVCDVSTASLTLRVTTGAGFGSTTPETDGLPQITLYQAIPKGRKLDEVVRQVVQAGVARIVPVITERTVVRPNERFEIRRERLQKIAREAIQQSGAFAPVEIRSPIRLDSLTANSDALSLVLHTTPLESPSLHSYLSDIPSRIELLVGPEGGFTDDEISRLRGCGFRAIYLGRQVLRTEAAGFYVVAAIRTLLLEHDEWQLTTDRKP
jgi:16S rRNA (uracil1498-N3)-methyltransferase